MSASANNPQPTTAGLSGRERFLRAARGEQVDRPPVGAWVHFGTALADPELTTAAHLSFLRAHDWDYLKVMHDYRVPSPDQGTLAARLEAFATLGTEQAGFARQRRVLTELRGSVPDKALVETLFSPFQTIIRSLGQDVVPLLQADPGLADVVIGRVAYLLADYASGLVGLGVDALFLALTGASSDWTSFGITAEQHRRWIAPHDITVLQAAAGLVRIGHLHGDDIHPGAYDAHPHEVTSWSDAVSRPTIAEVLEAGRIPLLGLDERAASYLGTQQVHEAVLAKRREARDRIIIGPNCTLHTDTNPDVLDALRSSVEVAL
ncbi:uroporphyrinogen decarboxylase [Propionibacteriaceae bacterium Y1923]|uniref:uroporphyrinogen decarboxylase family protein n=1 Tax=Aestuariimicrobium sp. Y1814 TaxID=3418742 RepID=UPI003C184F11